MGDTSKPKMTDEERKKMVEKMDQDLEEHFRKLEEKAKEREGTLMEGGFTEENWEEEMAAHPFFNQRWKEGEELSPLMKGIQDLKYSPDENSPLELAQNYKEDGNFNFKCKKYRFAIASYTEGLKSKCEDTLLNTQLLTNRAVCQYHIKNYRSCLKDCDVAIELTPTHMKAILRGAQASFQLKQYPLCLIWCDRGLKLDPKDADLIKLRSDAVRISKEKERDERKRAAAEKKKKEEERKILNEIKSKGIKVEKIKGNELSLADFEPCHPAAIHKPVHVDSGTGELVFPVLFLYPEFGETDFVEEWRELETLEQHIQEMFGDSAERPPWDTEKRYVPASLVVYLESSDQKLLEISTSSTLLSAITKPGFLLKAGTPNFIVFVRNSKSHLNFIKRSQ